MAAKIPRIISLRMVRSLLTGMVAVRFDQSGVPQKPGRTCPRRRQTMPGNTAESWPNVISGSGQKSSQARAYIAVSKMLTFRSPASPAKEEQPGISILGHDQPEPQVVGSGIHFAAAAGADHIA
jgi:hypothetical protein